MPRVFPGRFHGDLVKILRIYYCVNKAAFKQRYRGRGYSAQRPAHGYVLCFHLRLKVAVYRKRRPARARLERESVLKVRRCGHNVRAARSHCQLPHVVRHARGLGGYLRRVAYRIHANDIVHVYSLYACGQVRTRHERIGYYNNMVGVFCIRHCIGQHAAVALASNGAGVAEFVRGRRAYEGNVYMHVAFLYCPYPAAVGVYYGRRFQLAGRYDLAKSAAYAAGLYAGNYAFLYHVGYGVVRCAKA